MHADKKGLVLYESDLLNPETEGGRRISVLFRFCRTLYYFSTVTLIAAQSLSTLAIGVYSLFHLNVFVLHALYHCICHRGCCRLVGEGICLFTLFAF